MSKDNFALKDSIHIPSSINGKLLEQYLSLNGGEKNPNLSNRISDKISIFNLNDSEIIIPLNSEYSDYKQLITNALYKIKELKGINFNTLISDVVNMDYDIIVYRMDGPEVIDGTLPAPTGVDLVKNGFELIQHSLHQTIDLRANFNSIKNTKAFKNYLNSLKMPQTEVGSYIVKFLCPLLDKDEKNVINFDQTEFVDEHIGQTTTFSRRVLKNFFNSTELILKTIEKDDIDILKGSNNSYLVSPKFCDSLAEMRPSKNSGALHIDSNWSRLMPSPSFNSSIKIESTLFPEIAEIAKEIKTSQIKIQDTFIGYVSDLRGELNENGDRHGNATISFIYKNKKYKATVFLSEHDHTLAIRAYEENTKVKLTGTIDLAEKNKKITDYSAFELITNI